MNVECRDLTPSSALLRVELGREIEEIQTSLNLRGEKFAVKILRFMKKIGETIDRIQHDITSANHHNKMK